MINSNLRIFRRIFQPKIGVKKRIFSLGRKNNILTKKKECSGNDMYKKSETKLSKQGLPITSIES